MRNKSYHRWWFLAAMAAMPCDAATIFVEILPDPGTAAPPATLGGYFMEAFPKELRPELSMVSDAAAPAGGTLGFAAPLELDYVGSAWATWSHGYTGPAYYTTGESLELSFPAGTQAFYMYIQPNLKDVFEFTVSGGGAFTTLNIDGDGGARYVGIYIDDINSSLQGINIVQTNGLSDGFAVGEFAVDGTDINLIPEPGSLVGIGCVLASGLMLRNRRRKS